MRLKYYKLTLRQMSLKKPFVFFLTVVLLTVIIISIFNKKVEPTLKALCESNAHDIALKCTEDGVKNNIENITYNSLINIEKDNNGKITALTANVMEMNKLSNRIALEVESNVDKNEDSFIKFPLGSFLGNNLFGGFGPNIKINTTLTGNVKIEYLSSFDSVGINQTRHRISVRVITSVMTTAPFYTAFQDYYNDIVVAETIIVGDTPSSYYNIQGIDDLKGKDTLDLIEQ